MDNEFPPNSHAARDARPSREPVAKRPEREAVERVTTSKATVRKRPLHKKFFDAFRPEDNKGFVEFTIFEVLVPGIKDALAEAVHGTIDNALGSNRPRNARRGGGGGGYTSYNRMGAARPRGRDRDDDRGSSRRETRHADDVREVFVDTRHDAERVLDKMFELLSKYEAATMRDLLSLVGEPHNPTHEDWGWTDLRGARIHRVSGGYLIDLPRPEPLD